MLNDGRWVQSQDFFHDYFKGIAFIPDANDACISGFQVNDSSMCITVYYHQITETLNEKHWFQYKQHADLQQNRTRPLKHPDSQPAKWGRQ